MHMAFGVRSSLEVTLQIFRCEPLDNRFTPQHHNRLAMTTQAMTALELEPKPSVKCSQP